MNRRALVSAPIIIGTPAPLSRDDLAALTRGDRQIGVVARMRASHHRIARLLAHGLTNTEVAALTGFTRERVGQLAASPAMKELIANYMDRVAEKDEANADAYLDLKFSNMVAAERHIADAIDEADANGEILPIRTALAISADGADRLGYGKRTTTTNLNVDLGAALERAIARSGKVIEAKVEPTPHPKISRRA